MSAGMERYKRSRQLGLMRPWQGSREAAAGLEYKRGTGAAHRMLPRDSDGWGGLGLGGAILIIAEVARSKSTSVAALATEERCPSEASAWVDIIQCRLASVRRNRSDQAVNSDRMYRQVREDLLGRPTLGRAAHNSTQMLASFVMPMRVWCSNERGVHRHFARSRKTPQSFTIMCHTFHNYFLAVNFPPSNVCYAV